MKYLAAVALMGTMCLAAERDKPACRAQNHGRFWPEEANTSHEAARKLLQSGELEMCSLKVWRYGWEHLSVDARAVGRGRQASIKAESGGDAGAAAPVE